MSRMMHSVRAKAGASESTEDSTRARKGSKALWACIFILSLAVGLVVAGWWLVPSPVPSPHCVPLHEERLAAVVDVEIGGGKNVELHRTFQLDLGALNSHVKVPSKARVFRKNWYGTSTIVGADGPVKHVFPLVKLKSFAVGGTTRFRGDFAVASGHFSLGLHELRQMEAKHSLESSKLCFVNAQDKPQEQSLLEEEEDDREEEDEDDGWLTWDQMQQHIQAKRSELSNKLAAGIANAFVGLDLGTMSSKSENIGIDLGRSPASVFWDGGDSKGIDLGLTPSSVLWNGKSENVVPQSVGPASVLWDGGIDLGRLPSSILWGDIVIGDQV